MALRQNHPGSREDNTSKITGNSGSPLLQGSDDKLVNRVGATSDDADFDITGHELSDGSFMLSDEKQGQFEEDYPNIGGTSVIGLLIESDDDNQFEVNVMFRDENGSILARVDSSMDSNMSSSSPSNGKHFVYATVAVAGDYFDVEVLDRSDAGSNAISGTINAH